MEEHPSLYLGLVVIEKGVFGSLSTKVTNFTTLLTSDEPERFSKQNCTAEFSSKGGILHKIHRTILGMDTGKTSRNEPENKKLITSLNI